MVSYKVIVKGRVQGVSYRRFTKINAERFGIKGYVKNLDNSDVEVICSGDKIKIDLFLSELRKGNHYSHVDEMEIIKIPEISFDYFEIRY
jgi:acylphosphatase